MIKVLHVMGFADIGGISAVILNYYTRMDRTKIHFDIALTARHVGVNGEKLRKLGVNFYHIPLKSQDFNGYKQELSQLLQTHHYDAIHVHENETSYIALQVAKKEGVKCRIAHSHTAQKHKDIMSFVRLTASRILSPYFATKTMGCGALAGDMIFGRHCMKSKKGIVLPNAIDTEKFAYDETLRGEVRMELGIGNEFVVGMVGRVAPPKNNVYAIELFETIKNSIPNSRLVIAGNGPDEGIMFDKINELKLTDSVVFLGMRSDVDRLYQAFDIYLMPSLYEGFPVAATEAMGAGLPVLLSDTITSELSFGRNVRYLPLNDKHLWAIAAKEFISGVDRGAMSKEIKNNGFDINDTVKILEQVYLDQCD